MIKPLSFRAYAAAELSFCLICLLPSLSLFVSSTLLLSVACGCVLFHSVMTRPKSRFCTSRGLALPSYVWKQNMLRIHMDRSSGFVKTFTRGLCRLCFVPSLRARLNTWQTFVRWPLKKKAAGLFRSSKPVKSGCI